MYLLLYRIRRRYVSKDFSMENMFYEDENLIHVTNEIITILDMEDGVITAQVPIWFSHKILFQSYFRQLKLFDYNAQTTEPIQPKQSGLTLNLRNCILLLNFLRISPLILIIRVIGHQ